MIKLSVKPEFEISKNINCLNYDPGGGDEEAQHHDKCVTEVIVDEECSLNETLENEVGSSDKDDTPAKSNDLLHKGRLLFSFYNGLNVGKSKILNFNMLTNNVVDVTIPKTNAYNDVITKNVKTRQNEMKNASSDLKLKSDASLLPNNMQLTDTNHITGNTEQPVSSEKVIQIPISMKRYDDSDVMVGNGGNSVAPYASDKYAFVVVPGVRRMTKTDIVKFVGKSPSLPKCKRLTFKRYENIKRTNKETDTKKEKGNVDNGGIMLNNAKLATKRKLKHSSRKAETLTAKLNAIKEKSKIAKTQAFNIPLSIALEELEKREKATSETLTELIKLNKSACNVTNEDNCTLYDSVSPIVTKTGEMDPILSSVIKTEPIDSDVDYDLDKLPCCKTKKSFPEVVAKDNGGIEVFSQDPLDREDCCRTNHHYSTEYNNIGRWNSAQVFEWLRKLLLKNRNFCDKKQRKKIIKTLKKELCDVTGMELCRFTREDFARSTQEEDFAQYLFEETQKKIQYCADIKSENVYTRGFPMSSIEEILPNLTDVNELLDSNSPPLDDAVLTVPSIEVFSKQYIKEEQRNTETTQYPATQQSEQYMHYDNNNHSYTSLFCNNGTTMGSVTSSNFNPFEQYTSPMSQWQLNYFKSEQKDNSLNGVTTQWGNNGPNYSPKSDSDSGIHSPINPPCNFGTGYETIGTVSPFISPQSYIIPSIPTVFNPAYVSDTNNNATHTNVNTNLSDESCAATTESFTQICNSSSWDGTSARTSSPAKGTLQPKHKLPNKIRDAFDKYILCIVMYTEEAEVLIPTIHTSLCSDVRDNASAVYYVNNQIINQIHNNVFPMATSATVYPGTTKCDENYVDGTVTSHGDNNTRCDVMKNDGKSVNQVLANTIKSFDDDHVYRLKSHTVSGKGSHLWEFIRDTLLNSEYCPKLIRWEDRRTGVFRFVQSDAVAKMWGERKNNPKMTYEKLSRAMRYYYNRGILERVDGRRLVYKFGKNSHGWREEDEKATKRRMESRNEYGCVKNEFFSFPLDKDLTKKRPYTEDQADVIPVTKLLKHDSYDRNLVCRSAETQTVV